MNQTVVEEVLSMGPEISEYVAIAARAALEKASAYSEKGTEAHLLAVVRETLSLVGCEPGWPAERPVFDDLIATKISENEGIVLFEIEFIWAVFRAIARGARWKAVLIPAFHKYEHHNYILASPGVDERETVRVRGRVEVDPDDWRKHVDTQSRFAQILAAALSEEADGFAGMVNNVEEVTAMAGNDPVSQLRIVVRPAGEAYYDPVGELQATDAYWAARKEQWPSEVDIIAWQSPEVNERGYDIGQLRGDREHLTGLDTGHLREIIQLPHEEQTQLFVWDGAYTGPVSLTDLHYGSERTTSVTTSELMLRLDLTPSHYPDPSSAIKMAEIGSLIRKAQRGSIVNGKVLHFLGTVGEPRKGATIDLSTMTFYCENDLYYVDNASIAQNSVSPRVITEIPPKQEKHAILPEDGSVVLFARNGRGSACYKPRRPTLVSNNLFIIWPDTEKAAAEYLACALRSAVVRKQLASTRMPIAKTDLMQIIVPVGPKRLMESVVEREHKIESEKAELRYRLQLISEEDPIDQMWQQDPSGDGTASTDETEGDAR